MGQSQVWQLFCKFNDKLLWFLSVCLLLYSSLIGLLCPSNSQTILQCWLSSSVVTWHGVPSPLLHTRKANQLALQPAVSSGYYKQRSAMFSNTTISGVCPFHVIKHQLTSFITIWWKPYDLTGSFYTAYTAVWHSPNYYKLLVILIMPLE